MSHNQDAAPRPFVQARAKFPNDAYIIMIAETMTCTKIIFETIAAG